MSSSHQGQEHPHSNGLSPPSISVVPATPSGRPPLFPGDSLRETRRESDLEKSGSSGERAPSPYTRSVTEAEKTQKEIDVVMGMLIQLEVARFSFTGDNDPGELVRNLATDATLRAHFIKLKGKKNVLEWRALASKRSMFNLDPVVVERLLDIQRDSASAVGALAVVGATLAYSTMYSATRGNMWYPFIAWWMFVISMATTSALSLAASGSSISAAGDLLETDDNADETSSNLSSPTTRNWLFQKLSVAIVGLSLTGVAGGWAVLAMGATGYNLSKELNGTAPAISEGPNLGNGIELSSRLISYIIIGIFVIVLIGGYFYRLRPRFHALEYKSIFLSDGQLFS